MERQTTWSYPPISRAGLKHRGKTGLTSMVLGIQTGKASHQSTTFPNTRVSTVSKTVVNRHNHLFYQQQFNSLQNVKLTDTKFNGPKDKTCLKTGGLDYIQLPATIKDWTKVAYEEINHISLSNTEITQGPEKPNTKKTTVWDKITFTHNH